jgi:hypothetical protein
MMNRMRRRFWSESALGVITAVMFMVTLVRRDWIESVVGIDPDRHSGALEWLIVAGLLAATVALFSLAAYEWRRAAARVA